MAEKKKAIRSPKPATKRPTDKQSRKTPLVATDAATDAVITESAPVPAPPKSRKGTQNQPQPEPHGDVDSRLADKIASTEVVVQLKPSTPAPEPTVSPLAAKVQYLQSLLAEGNSTALEDALKSGAVKVRVPGTPATRVVRRDPAHRKTIKKNWSKLIVAEVRKLRKDGVAYAKIEDMVDGLSPDKGRTSWAIVNLLQGDGF